MKRPFQILFLALVLAALGQAIWQHQHLPERVAAHFNASGHANGWLSRGQQTALHVGTILFLAGLLQGVTMLQRRLPKDYVNLPHRDHWLAPERAEATRDWIAAAVLGIGCALMLFFLTLFHLVYRANLTSAPQLGSTIWLATGALLAVVFGVLAALWRRFARPPAA